MASILETERVPFSGEVFCNTGLAEVLELPVVLSEQPPRIAERKTAWLIA
jgi:hypothetical protein